MARSIIVGDQVVVLSGDQKGVSGAVMKVIRSRGIISSVVVAGVAVRARNKKKGTRQEAPIAACKVGFLDPTSKLHSKIGWKLNGKEKVRVFKSSGQEVVS